VSSDPAQMPRWRPQSVNALPASPEAAVQQVKRGSRAGQEVDGRVWDVVATRNSQEATNWVSALQAPIGDQTSLVARVRWSDEAERNLATVVISPAVRNRLTSNVAEILHDILPERYFHCVEAGDAGFSGDVMWHRGVAHEYELLPDQDDRAEDYFLFYRRFSSGPEFEVLAVRSIYQVADRWERRSRSPLLRPIRSLRRRLPWNLPW
jgi:hypothetical protein